MNTLSSEDGDASERELLVDDIQRIRQVLHISAGSSNKLCSDEEEEEDSDEEDEEDDEPGENEESSLIGVISKNLQDQNVNYVSPLPSKITSPEQVFKNENVREQSSVNGGQELVSIPNSNHVPLSASLFQVQPPIENNLPPSQCTENVSSAEYVLTELQPQNFQPPMCLPSSSQGEYPQNGSWFAELNELHGPNEVDQQEGEHNIFHDVEEEIDGVSEMYSDIQQCLSLNRDYQLAILDELERIEIALAKNREKQYGLHQMRANKDEGKPEPHTLAKFANPYFKDTSSMGPPDNDDTKIKRQSCHFEGYQTSSKFWNQKERNSLAEGVRMQNLENKLFPVLQRIQKLEVKRDKTESESQELEDLKAESLRIKNLPKEKLERDLEAIDWDRISSTYVQKRSGFQCRLQWCNFGHPDVNQKPWTKEEDKMLIKLAKEPENTWDVIAHKLQTKRTPIHCYERYQRSLNKNLLKSKWTPEDDQQLLQVVQIVGLGNWPRVASFLEGRHGDQCLHRYTQTLRMVKKGKWYEDEDKLLIKAFEKYGACNWNKLSEMVPGRSGPQCRERWVNALDPNINKGPWTKEDDRKLLEYVEKLGKGNWSKIARAMGDRTDNQCWRRWIVLCKDDFLYYRQNTLRKKRELVANFTGRRQERPSLEPEDLDIPDVPVVRKRKGPVPLPIEESRARRRATRARFREKKRAEKREAQRKEAETQQAEEQQSKETASSEQQSTAGAEGEIEDDVNDAEEGSSESKKSPRIRKAGGNRSRVQQPHHRVLMKNKQLSKRKRVAEKREKRHTGSSSEEKQVTVTGSLGPFSLLLQAFSIDIPTVLQSIQTTPTASSTSTPSSGANGAADVVNNQRGEEISSEDQQSQRNQSVSCNPQSRTGVTCSGQTTLAEPQNHEKDHITDEEKLVKGIDSPIDRHQAAKSTDAEPAVGSQISNEESNSAPSNTHAPASTDRVEAGNESTAERPRTSQATRRRAPAIPPLPPCLTTLKTFKALLLLRPHLQQIAAMLNTPLAVSAAATVACQRSSTVGAAGSHSNQISNVTFVNEEDVRVSSHESRGGVVDSPKNIDAASGKDAVHESHNEIRLDEIVGNDHVVSRGHPRDTKGGNESGEQMPTSIDAVTEGGPSSGHSRLTTEGPRKKAVDNTGSQQIQISELPSHVINREGQAISSCRDSDRVQTGTVPASTIVGNEQIDRSLVQNSTQKSPTTVAPGISLNNASYRNSYEYKMLSSRFSSLFLWPALLSKIRVKGSSQIRPVFAERHPPPSTGGGGSNTENAATLKRKPAEQRQTDAIRRKRPGLAAVRMASSASLSTPGQQMCIVGQGSAIKKETPARQPDDPSVSFAASQLLSLHETARSLSMPAASTSPCNTRKSKRKATPVKRSLNQTHSTCASKRSKYLESSDSSSSSEDESSFSEDDSLETEYLPVKSKYNTVATGAAMKTRQSSEKTHNLVESDAKLSSDIQATPSTSSDKVDNADEITPTRVVNTGDSTDVSQPSLLVVQEGYDVRPAQGEETAGQQSGVATNQDLSKKSQLNKNNSPSSSSKRKICKPDKNRGARWRAMLPKVDSEDSDSGDNVV